MQKEVPAGDGPSERASVDSTCIRVGVARAAVSEDAFAGVAATDGRRDCLFGAVLCAWSGGVRYEQATSGGNCAEADPAAVALGCAAQRIPAAHQGRFAAAATGLGGLDGYDRYREVALVGARGEPGADLMRMEAAALRSRGWWLFASYGSGKSKHVPIGTPGAIVIFNGPRDHEFVSLSVYTSIRTLNNGSMGPPLDPGPKIRRALRAHRPVLDMNSAQRSYKPLTQRELN